MSVGTDGSRFVSHTRPIRLGDVVSSPHASTSEAGRWSSVNIRPAPAQVTAAVSVFISAVSSSLRRYLRCALDLHASR